MPDTRVTILNDFAAGQMEPRALAQGEYLEIYRRAVLESKNLRHYFRGGVDKRPGFVPLVDLEEDYEEREFVEWKLADDEKYIILLQRSTERTGINFTFIRVRDAQEFYVAGTMTRDDIDLGQGKLADIHFNFVNAGIWLCHRQFFPIFIQSPEPDSFDIIDPIFINGPADYLGNTTADITELSGEYGGQVITLDDTLEAAPEKVRNNAADAPIPQKYGAVIYLYKGGWFSYKNLPAGVSASEAPKKAALDLILPQGKYGAAFNPVKGYPTCSAFYFGRLMFAGTSRNPNRMWFSRTNLGNNFAETHRVADPKLRDEYPGEERRDTWAFTQDISTEARIINLYPLEFQLLIFTNTATFAYETRPAADEVKTQDVRPVGNFTIPEGTRGTCQTDQSVMLIEKVRGTTIRLRYALVDTGGRNFQSTEESWLRDSGIVGGANKIIAARHQGASYGVLILLGDPPPQARANQKGRVVAQFLSYDNDFSAFSVWELGQPADFDWDAHRANPRANPLRYEIEDIATLDDQIFIVRRDTETERRTFGILSDAALVDGQDGDFPNLPELQREDAAVRFTLAERDVAIQAAAYGAGAELAAAAQQRRGYPENYTLTDAEGTQTQEAATEKNKFTFNQNNWAEIPALPSDIIAQVGVVIRRDGAGGAYLITQNGAGKSRVFAAPGQTFGTISGAGEWLSSDFFRARSLTFGGDKISAIAPKGGASAEDIIQEVRRRVEDENYAFGDDVNYAEYTREEITSTFPGAAPEVSASGPDEHYGAFARRGICRIHME